MKYFFVSQRGTFKVEHAQRFLWAPQDGLWHHESMREVKKGDAIIQYNGNFVGIGLALRDCYPAIQPSNNSFNKWGTQGYKVDVEQHHFITPVKKESVVEELFQCQPKVHGPIGDKKKVKQCYLFPANEAMVDIILRKALEIDQSPRQAEIVNEIQEKLNIDLSKKGEGERVQREDAMKKSDYIQKIFFGAPGTGKSFKIDDPEKGYGLKNVPESRKFRTTFHPDYDYAQFVGAYKPKKDGNAITYSFVPQVFAKAYAAAWKLYLQRDSRDSIGASPLQNDSGKDIQVYLVIEEINRGNCAQIFGDIFQLLDRDSEGFSQYSIDADCDFAEWLKTNDNGLKSVWSAYEKKVGDGKLKLPPNLNILATMNTSDQSLFPMDSAFKRRFDWEYVSIKYAKDSDCGDDWKADKFQIVIGNSTYMWLDFLKKVNADIDETTHSEDKQMGEFFIKPKSDDLKIAFNEFRSKVLFYLWDSVYKDETERQAVFHFPYGEGDGKINSVTFQSLFGKDAEAIVNKIMENLKVEKVTA